MGAVSVTSEAEERAKREAEEQTQQQEEAMDPQEAPSESEQSEPKQAKVEEEESESEAKISPPDANTGEMEEGTQPAESSHQNPPLQNGMSGFCQAGLEDTFTALDLQMRSIYFTNRCNCKKKCKSKS